ncbi:MAG TPA: hypothetical protein VFW33_02445 [Gemmataceae bacterium]|nr:hypothetical protein [Gemmataceae bacterium]
MRRLRLRAFLASLAALAAALVLLGPAGADQLLREGFEGTEPLWVKGASDGVSREVAHKITDERPFRGQRCEFIQVNVESGTSVTYTFDTGRAPVGDELKASLWLRANRPGTQLLARVVLPHEPNPDRIEESTTVLIRGDGYNQAGRWQRLDLSKPTKLLRDQQQLLRAQLKHDVNVADAYVDRLVLNVNGGPGDNQVWIDNLEIGPVQDGSPFKTTGRANPSRTDPLSTAPRGRLVELRRDGLRVNNKPFFFSAIRWSDTPLDVLKEAGINTLCFDAGVKPAVIQEAAAKGFFVVPSMPLADGPQSADALALAVQRFTANDNVLFWEVGGGGLAKEQAQAAGDVARLIRGIDAQRPVAVDVWDGYESYRQQKIDMLEIHRWPLGTGLELGGYRDWLVQRRNIPQSRSFPWTWVQTHLSDWYLSLVYDRPGAGPAFDEPIGPQPEQIRLLTYIAVGTGCRGLGFWSDRFLADSHTGQDRLLTLALLNRELSVLQSLLLTSQAPEWVETSVPEVKAAVFRPLPEGGRGVVILPMWLGSGGQFVPAQGAYNGLKITLPLPQYLQVWEVLPGIVRPVEKAERCPGGVQITLREFDLTTALVCTSDVSLIVDLQLAERNNHQLAAQWSHDLAVAELKKVRTVYERLDQVGHRLPDGPGLLAKAERSLRQTEDLWDAHKYGEAYLEAQRALRPLRILQRASWEDARKDMVSGGAERGGTALKVTRGQAPADAAPPTRPLSGPASLTGYASQLDTPVSSPYAVSFYTLPRHWQFMDEVRACTPMANVLPGGDFEAPPGNWPEAWLEQKVTLPTDGVELSADRVAEDPKEGKQCLRLQIKAKDPLHAPAALERTFLAVHTPAVRLPSGTLVRITGWVRLPGAVTASTDGALVYDSAGGEPLAVRLTASQPKWKQFTLYRKVPSTGTVNVTMALTGTGTVYFDDVKIEPLQPATR